MDFKSNEFIHKLTSAMQCNPGMWYEVLADTEGRAHAVVRTPEFLRLYGYANEEEFPAEKPLSMVKAEHQFRVARRLVEARRSTEPGKVFDCTFQATTRAGRAIWVQAVVQTLNIAVPRADGTMGTLRVLVSLHTDVTPAQKQRDEFGRMQLFYEEMLDAVPGFVFVKEVLSTVGVARRRIEFRYANAELVARLLEKDVNEVSDRDRQELMGKTDEYYMGRTQQVERFEEADLKVHDTQEPEFLPEETFGPKDNPLRLATVKVPFWTSRWAADGVARKYVLGVAIDVTHITELLRKVIAESTEGIYVKDKAGKYLFGNATFRRELLDLAPDGELEGRTFGEIIRAHGKYEARKAEMEQIIAKVEAEDAALWSEQGDEVLIEQKREALFGKRRSWLSTKQVVRHPTAKSGVTLGIVKDVLHAARIAEEIVKRMTQCAAVKAKNGEVVWHNGAYGEQHRVADLRGRREGGLFDHFPEQEVHSEKFRAMDAKVILWAEEWEAAGRLEPVPWENLKYWRYSDKEEDLLMPTGEVRKLQTTKWPVSINGQWHTAVVYSDVTKGVFEIEERHLFITHSMKNQLMSALLGRDLVDKLTPQPEETQALLDARRFVRIGLGGLKFYLDHLIRFMRAQMKIKSVSCGEVRAILQKLVDTLGELNRDVIGTQLLSDEDIGDEKVLADLEFLEPGLQELLHNAEKAVKRRMSRFKREDYHDAVKTGRAFREWKPGSVVVTMRRTREGESSVGPGLQISVSDTGDAVARPAARAKLKEMWRQIKEGLMPPEGAIGLKFIEWLVVKKHAGSFKLVEEDDSTQFQIVLPLDTSSAH